MEKGRGEVDELCVFDLRSPLQSRPRRNENSVETMRAAPDRIFGWAMLTNNDGRHVPILSQTWRRREEAIFAPPIENEVGGFVGKRTVEKLVASINAGDY